MFGVEEERLDAFRREWKHEMVLKRQRREEEIRQLELHQEEVEKSRLMGLGMYVIFTLLDTSKLILDILLESSIEKSSIIMLKRTCHFFYDHIDIKRIENSARFRYRKDRYLKEKIEKEVLSAICDCGRRNIEGEIHRFHHPPSFKNVEGFELECFLLFLLIILFWVGFAWLLSYLPDVKPPP